MPSAPFDTLLKPGDFRYTEGDLDEAKREAFDDGRAEAAKVFPLVHDEGYQEGWAACMNMVFRRLRERAGKDRTIRELLVELLDA